MTDDRKFAGQMRRYAKVGGAMAGLGARLAGARYLGMGIDRASHAEELTRALGGLKGPVMKLAQILAGIPDALPREYAEALRQLQADAPPMGWPFVRRRMAGELGQDWQGRFADFSHSAAHAASLGQVHRAQLPDGQAVACKLQYPDMASVVDADLAQLKLIFALYERYDRAISTAHIHAELSARLREELDYGREARAVGLYRTILADEDRVSVPEVFPDLCTDRLLTMEWLSGTPLLEFRDAPTEARNAIARAMFRAWYVPFYYYGVIHGDPHMGNYTVRPDHGVNLLDFGCIRIFPPRFVKGVIDLYRALRADDMELARHAYASWGFNDVGEELLEVLNIWARFLYGPLLSDKVRTIQEESESGLYGARIAGKVHAELRRLGGIRPPREFVLMDRAAVGLGSVFMHLKAEINWHRLFHDLIDDFDIDGMKARQDAALTAAGLQDSGD